MEDIDKKVIELKDFLDNEMDSKDNNTNKDNQGVEIDIEEKLVLKNIPDDLNDIEREMFETIYNTDKQSWVSGIGLQSGFDMFDDKLSGIQSGLALIGADSNTGKSTFLVNIGFNTALNDDVYALYLSFDDDATNLLPRVVAMNQNIPINAIRMPERYLDYPKVLDRRKKGLEELYNLTDKFKLIDNEKYRTMEELKKVVLKHLEYAKENDKKLFVLIDSFHDINLKEKTYDNNDKYDKIANQLETFAKVNDIPIWCTAEIKKLNAYRRPIMDDIRHSSRIKFKAKLILLLHNDVGQKGENSSIFYRNKDRPGKSPVIECHFAKNKFSSYKGRVYFEFIPEYAKVISTTENEKQRYDTLVHQDN